MTLDEAKKIIFDLGYIPQFSEFKSIKEKIDFSDKFGYWYSKSISVLKNRQKTDKFNKANPYTIQNIKVWLTLNNKPYKLISTEYKTNSELLIWKCEKHGAFKSNLNNIIEGKGCPFCSGKKINDTNSLYSLRPDLHKYFDSTGLEASKNLAVTSNKKITVKCPNCGRYKEKMIIVHNLTRQGFYCDYCSDGISVPEKFGMELLRHLNVNFETQKSFNSLKSKRYDFYINSSNIIIEVHGAQHYLERGFTKSLKEEQDNDKLKYKLATQNGIEENNYIVVDARYSTFGWLKENFINALESHFDLSDINWDEIWIKSQNNLVFEIGNAWNNKKEQDNSKTIAKTFGLSSNTVVKYLKICSEIGLCKYNPKEEIFKGNSKSGKMNIKTTYQYSLDDEFIKEWKSVTEIEDKLGFAGSNISSVCNGRQKTAFGYKWSHNPPNENGMYPD